MRTATGNDLVTQERDRKMLQELKTEIDGLKEKVDAQAAQGSGESNLLKKLQTLEERTKMGFAKVKTEFTALTTSVQQTQKETDEEQDKQLKEIEEKVKAVELAVGDANAVQENTEKLTEM